MLGVDGCFADAIDEQLSAAAEGGDQERLEPCQRAADGDLPSIVELAELVLYDRPELTMRVTA